MMPPTTIGQSSDAIGDVPYESLPYPNELSRLLERGDVVFDVDPETAMLTDGLEYALGYAVYLGIAEVHVVYSGLDWSGFGSW